jgi:peptidoglycan hydrolase CwlO-like protein
MRSKQFVIVVWVVIVGFILLLANAAAKAGEFDSLANKDGNIVLTKQEFTKLMNSIKAYNLQIQLMAKRINDANKRFDKAEECVIQNAEKGLPATPCFGYTTGG